MSINLGVLSIVPCVNKPPGPDSRCDDEAFSLANPDICPQEQVFIIKPGVALICELASVKLRAFTVANGIETDVTADAIFTTSDDSIVLVSAMSGDATGVSHGDATITATYVTPEGVIQTAQAQLTVLAGQHCCDDVTVAIMVLVDQTKSMSQSFGTGYSTKLVYAKAAATALINSVNENKDYVGLEKFTKTSNTLLSTPTQSKAAAAALVPSIIQTQIDTSFYDAMVTGMAALDLVNADRKLLVIISDGEDTTDTYATYNPLVLANDFRAAGGIILCLGVRAHGPGYNFLSAIATGGFFINAYQDTAAASLSYLNNLKSYICGGDCEEDGDEYDYRGSLCYSDLANWDLGDVALVINTALDPVNPLYLTGCVDLLGNGFFDTLPNNGLYVDLVSDTNPSGIFNPLMVSKAKYSLTATKEYRLALQIAGNQLINAQSHVQVKVVAVASGTEILNNVVLITDFTQGFQSYGWTFVAPNTEDVKITIMQTTASANLSVTQSGQRAGALLNEVKFDNVTDGVNLLNETFNTENSTYIGPKCGAGSALDNGNYVPTYSYYGCYGDGCLDTPPISQLQDPHPLPNLELGTSSGLYSSTQNGCAPACATGFIDIGWPLSATTQTPGDKFETVIQLAAAKSIKRWAVTFDRYWSQMNNPTPTALALEGSTNGSTWVSLDLQTQIVSGVAGLKLIFTLASESAAYQYFRASIGDDPDDTSTDEVLSLEVYITPTNPICKTAAAYGYSQSQAISNALQAAIGAAKAEQNCVQLFSASEIYTADDGSTGSGAADSLNSLAEAQAIASAAAEAAAVP